MSQLLGDTGSQNLSKHESCFSSGWGQCPEGQAGLDSSAAQAVCSVFQDELSHINARLNMGILGCEYTCVFHLLELVLGDGSELFQAESQAGRVPVFSVCSSDLCTGPPLLQETGGT